MSFRNADVLPQVFTTMIRMGLAMIGDFPRHRKGHAMDSILYKRRGFSVGLLQRLKEPGCSFLFSPLRLAGLDGNP